jgi:2-polyprenyl-3-methyl-5-hydroxy-6-metoxy-1,4-benzoquinol methylase
LPESPACALCGAEDFHTVLQGGRDHVWRKPGTWSLQECRACGLVMTRPRPTAEELPTFYEGAYSGEGQQAEGKKQGADNLIGRLLSDHRLGVLHKVHALGPQDHLLDVGCSYGGLLKRARDKTGCTTSGVDFDEGSIAGAIEPELCDYRSGTLVEAGYEAESFTVITFMECLEHDPVPAQSLAEAHRLLKPGGLVSVEVPNWEGAWRSVFGRYWLPLLLPQHLVHYRPATLSRMLEQAGFEVVHQQTMFFPLEGVASLWMCLVAWFGIPPAGSKPTWKTPFHLMLFAWIAMLWFTFEVPSQLVLRLLGRSGHMTVIGKKAS